MVSTNTSGLGGTRPTLTITWSSPSHMLKSLVVGVEQRQRTRAIANRPVVVVLPQKDAVVKRDPCPVYLWEQAHVALVLEVCNGVKRGRRASENGLAQLSYCCSSTGGSARWLALVNRSPKPSVSAWRDPGKPRSRCVVSEAGSRHHQQKGSVSRRSASMHRTTCAAASSSQQTSTTKAQRQARWRQSPPAPPAANHVARPSCVCRSGGGCVSEPDGRPAAGAGSGVTKETRARGRSRGLSVLSPRPQWSGASLQ